MHRYLEDNCKSLHGRSNILSKRSIVLIILIHNHLYKSIEESDQHHHGRASSPHQRQGHRRQGPPPHHRTCRAPPPPSTGYRARGEESKPEILENKNRAESCRGIYSSNGTGLFPQYDTRGTSFLPQFFPCYNR